MDFDENSLDSATADQHQFLKTAQSQSKEVETLKSQLTNGSFGMEDEDYDYSNQALLKQNDEAENITSTNRPLDVSCEPELSNGLNEEHNLSELSPSLRRSTRASALKAQEKIRLKDGSTPTTASNMVDSHVVENGQTDTAQENEVSAQTTAADSDQQLELPIKKKRKLSTSDPLDQFDCKFGIRLDADGDVVMMTDGSEISSLNEEEAVALRQKYTEIISREDAEMSLEKSKEQEFQVRELESALRLEEAKLAMLKKIRTNQQITARNAIQENARRLTANLAQNVAGNAYKPTISQQQNMAAKLNGAVNLANSKQNKNKTGRPNISPAGNFQLTPQHQQLIQKLLDQGTIRPDQLATILHSLNPQVLASFSQGMSKSQQDQKLREQQDKERKLRLEQEARKVHEASEIARQARDTVQTAQQKAATARVQFKRRMEQQLLQLPLPKAPSSDLSFIPNATQPDFLYLLGLDLVVQRNLKDKAVFKKIEVDPYECEECGTDFTPNWKACYNEKKELQLKCEQCMRLSQKRKSRLERKNLYKKVFQTIAEQEKELERQISLGKLNDIPSVSKDSATTSGQNNLSTKASNFNAAALSGLTSSTKSFSHTAASLASNSNTNNRNLQNNFGIRNNQIKQDPLKKNIPSVQQQQSRKRPNATSGSSNSASNASATFAALNPNALSMLQQMTNMPTAFRNIPMLASLMSNPQMMTAFYNQMLQQQRANTSSSSSSGGSSNQISALLQAFAQQQGSRNTSSSNHTSSHQHQSSNQSGSSLATANLLSQMSPALIQQLIATANQRKK